MSLCAQVRPEGQLLAPPSPLNEDADSPRSGGAGSAAALAAAASMAEGNGMGGEGDKGMGDDGGRLPDSERVMICTQVMKLPEEGAFVDAASFVVRSSFSVSRPLILGMPTTSFVVSLPGPDKLSRGVFSGEYM